ncbi:MAG: polymorphic toxin type 44 domain-containing protein [Pseudodesulfovibrio sp.]|uniref:polymorphic toxin type 44 domain-containing protein n=1 Tax=Pseudodesulfovibrio sp. TaxID=2035812 RepID=UPI003D1368BA
MYRRIDFPYKCLWIYRNFKNGGRYDFKQRGKEYEDFGNYHYGLYTRAMGVSINIAQAGAGAAQLAAGTHKSNGTEHGSMIPVTMK